jgi:hypothetical protein
MPDSLKQAEMSLVTLDFPLVPLTQILNGIFLIFFVIFDHSTIRKEKHKRR